MSRLWDAEYFTNLDFPEIRPFLGVFPYYPAIWWGRVRSLKDALNSMCHDHCESGWTSSGTSGKTGEEPFQRPQKIAGIGGDQKWNVSDLLGEGSWFFSWIESCHIVILNNARSFNTYTHFPHCKDEEGTSSNFYVLNMLPDECILL